VISPVSYLKEVWLEVTRVVWPAPRTAAIHTVIVILAMIGIIAVVGGIDFVLVNIVRKVLLKG